ncbi:iron uptake porin [Leptothermofonsia sp. ETS-13]|uniref:iron uptake porin n=1 Tax=Leptothermofonsia sp. ETS-13 TaxID=3035696 RepID=UPI003BA012A6
MFETVRSVLWLTPVFLGATAVSAVASVENSKGVLAEQDVIQTKSAPVLVADTSLLKADASTSISMPQPSVSNLASVDAGALDQVTSVSQLTDVRPTDWAFQALQSLVERYGCIVGYPDKTYRGNRALSRYEFAAGLNACMDRISELIAASTADLVKKEDLLALQKLQEEFAAELAALRGRVDQLEVRTATLEKQQFSTTTKLTGEVIFAVADTWGDAATRRGNGAVIGGVNDDDNTQPILANRVRLNFDTSFTGKDRLRTRLQAANVNSFSGNLTGTNMTRLSFDGSDDNAFSIDELYYRFPIGDNLRVQIDATNTEFYDALISTNSPFESSGSGAVSRFGRFNPFLRSGSSGAGLTFDIKLGDWANLQAGYIADSDSNVPLPKNGLFNGSYSAIGQLVLKPFKDLSLGLFYNHSYYSGGDVNITASTGSEFARRPFGSGVATSNDTVGANLQWKISKNFIFGGWFGYMWANRRSNSDQAQILNAAVYLGFPDLLKKGNLGGLLVGIPPYVVDNDVNREDEDTPIHVEAFYRFKVTNNIAVTPGFFVIINPEGNSDNDTQFVGTIRTTFSF